MNGSISAWSAMDGVGRVTTDTGEVIRFGRTACAFEPAVALKVTVSGMTSHPLGGQKATNVMLVDANDSLKVLDDRDPLTGLVADAALAASFAELVTDVGLFGVVLRAPLRSRQAVADWFATAGLTVDFGNARCPLVRIGAATFRVWVCMAPMAGGQGVVAFALDTPFSLQTERSQFVALCTLEPSHTDSAWKHLAPLAQAVAKLAAPEVAVLVPQARNYVLPAEDWAPLLQAPIPVRALVSIGIPPENNGAFTTGLRALQLPDLQLRADLTTDAAAAEARRILYCAAEAMVVAGRPPAVGATLVGLKVTVSTDTWVLLSES